MICNNRRVHRIVLELTAPLHIGGGGRDLVYDAAVTRNAFGQWTVPGSSIAGVLRGIVREIDGESAAAETFGSIDGDLADASAVLVSDGELIDFDGRSAFRKAMACEAVAMPTDLRVIEDHVRLDDAVTGSPGTAADGGKYDLEVIPEGVRFAVEIECHDAVDSHANRKRLDAALGRILSGGASLGGRGGSGLGRVRSVDHSFRDFDLASRDDLIAFAALDDDPSSPIPGATDAVVADHDHPRGHEGLSGRISLRFEASGPLLVGGSQGPLGTEDGADLVCNRQPVLDWKQKRFVDRPVIPGSGIRGMIRSRVVHALVASGRPDHEVQTLVDRIFGSVNGGDGRRGRLRVEGVTLDEMTGTVIQHVGIDRLTGGSLRSALFSEAPIWEEALAFEVGIHLDGLGTDHLAVLAQAIWDVHEGLAPIGGGTRRGNGRLRIASKPDGFHGLDIGFDLALDGEPLDADRLRELEERLLGVQLKELLEA